MLFLIPAQVDGGGGERGDEVRRLVENFTLPRARVEVRAKEENEGFMAAWRTAWQPRPGELALIAEDDAELSVHWYRWLARAWLQYGARPELAAISLAKQQYSSAGQRVDLVSLVQPSPLFLYSLPGFFCQSPHPAHWAAFMQQFSAQFGPCPPDTVCIARADRVTGEVEADTTAVEPWWVHYFQQHYLFSLYLAHPATLGLDWREAGKHYSQA